MDKDLDKELGQVLSRVFLLQSHLSKFARGTWTRNLDNCGLPCYKLSQYYAPIPGRPRFRVPRPGPGGNPNLDKNLDKELGQVLSRVFLLQSHLSKFARGTWTRNLDNCGCRVTSSLSITPRFQAGPDSNFVAQGGNPNLDKNLDKDQSLKRCVQACGCKIMTPRYAPQFGSRLHFKRSPVKVGSLEMQPGAKLQAYLGVIILQPHACAQRFRLRILRRTRSNAGRTSAGSLSGKTPSKERARGARDKPVELHWAC